MDDRPSGDVKSDGEVTHLLECGFKTMCIRKTARSGFFLLNDIPNPTGKVLAGGVFFVVDFGGAADLRICGYGE